CAGAIVAACAAPLPRDAAEGEVHVVYDPTAGALPMPNDLVRDDEAGHLALPIGEGLSAAEAELRAFLNTHDAWPTTTALSGTLSGRVLPASIRSDTVLVYEWAAVPRPVEGVVPRLEDDDTKIVVDPPVAGWRRGA